MPKIAITTTTYNGEEWLRHVSLESVRQQTLEDWAIFIVHDGLEIGDKTREYIHSLGDKRIHFMRVPRVTPPPKSGNRFDCYKQPADHANSGHFACQVARSWLQETYPECEIIVVLDHDDYLSPPHLQNVYDFMAGKPYIHIAHSMRWWHYRNEYVPNANIYPVTCFWPKGTPGLKPNAHQTEEDIKPDKLMYPHWSGIAFRHDVEPYFVPTVPYGSGKYGDGVWVNAVVRNQGQLPYNTGKLGVGIFSHCTLEYSVNAIQELKRQNFPLPEMRASCHH